MLKVGIAGLGVVGMSCLELLVKHQQLMAKKSTRPFKIVAVSSRTKKDTSHLLDVPFYLDPLEMLEHEKLDVVIELMGGSEGTALAFAQKALSNKIHLVTANKALLAHHGNELFSLAAKNDVFLGFEAAVAGTIPCINALREGLAANDIIQVYGLLNGTSNYILTQMTQTGASFEEVLKTAQELGYAEADPTFDIEGIDAAHKLSLLTAMAFGQEIDFDSVRIQGISDINSVDIAYAKELGYKIKLLALSRRTKQGIEQRVQPVMLPHDHPIGQVDGVLNTVIVEGDYCGRVQLSGAGAGGDATASAVASDVLNIAKGCAQAPLSFLSEHIQQAQPIQFDKAENSYYLRIDCDDHSGVLAKITSIFSLHDLSVLSVIQHEPENSGTVPVVFTLRSAKRETVMQAIADLELLDDIKGKVRYIRIEKF